MLKKKGNKTMLKQPEPLPTTDVFSSYYTSIMGKLHDALEVDLKTMTKTQYSELVKKKILEEELKKEKFIRLENIKELAFSNQILVNYHLTLALLENDPRYNKTN